MVNPSRKPLRSRPGTGAGPGGAARRRGSGCRRATARQPVSRRCGRVWSHLEDVEEYVTGQPHSFRDHDHDEAATGRSPEGPQPPPAQRHGRAVHDQVGPVGIPGAGRRRDHQRGGRTDQQDRSGGEAIHTVTIGSRLPRRRIPATRHPSLRAAGSLLPRCRCLTSNLATVDRASCQAGRPRELPGRPAAWRPRSSTTRRTAR